jgi:hypothetical protein
MAISLDLLRGSGRIAVPLLSGLIACGGGDRPSPSAPPAPAATREGCWIQDIDYLAAELPRLHPNLFFQASRGEFDSVVAAVRATAATAPDHVIVAGLMRIVAVAGDGHTAVYRWRGFGYLPLALTRLADGLYVTGASASLASSLGMRVVAIGDVPVAVLEARAAPFVSHENEAWLRVQVPLLLAIPEMLHVLGAAGDPTTATFRLEAPDGSPLPLEVSALSTPPLLVDVTTAAGAGPQGRPSAAGPREGLTVRELVQPVRDDRDAGHRARDQELLEQDALRRKGLQERPGQQSEDPEEDEAMKGRQDAGGVPASCRCHSRHGGEGAATWPHPRASGSVLPSTGAMIRSSPMRRSNWSG